MKDYKERPKAKKRLTDFDFSAEGSHIALVDAAANGQTVLVTKAADELMLSLSMEQFLVSFFDMWRIDAATLSMLLGYGSEVYEASLIAADKWDDTWEKDEIESKLRSMQLVKSVSEGLPTCNLNDDSQVALLKAQEAFEKNLNNIEVKMSMQEFLDYFFDLEEQTQTDQLFSFENRSYGKVPVTNEPFLEQRLTSMDFMKSLNQSKDFDSLTDEQSKLFKLFQWRVEKNLLIGDEISKQGDKSPITENLNNLGVNMTDNVAPESLAKLEKALADQGEILKSLQEENESLKAEKEEAKFAEFVKQAKSFEFIAEDKAEGVAAMFKSLDKENLELLVDVLKSAKDAISAKAEEEANGEMFQQKSASGEGEGVVVEDDIRLALVNKALGISKDAE